MRQYQNSLYECVKMIFLFLAFTGTALVRESEASHSVAEQYSGSGFVNVTFQGPLEDIEGVAIKCVLSGSTHVDIVWKWRDAHTLNIDHYFEWYTTDITFGGSSLSSSIISFKNDLSNADRRDASGVIYAEGAHEDTNIKIPCNDVSLTIIWKAEGTPSLLVNKNPLVIGEDSTAQLTCQLTDKGNPEGQVRWIRNGNQQRESEYNTQTINIPVTTDIEGDKWLCYYYNTAGDGEYSNEVILNVHWKPEGTPSLLANKYIFLYEDDTAAKLTCQLTDKGNPDGQVRWVKNGNLQNGSENNSPNISIPVTKDIDGDKWQCYYYNAAGDGDYSNEVVINVHWKPGAATILPDPRSPNLDQLLTFTCIGDQGNPRSTLFYKNTVLAKNISNSRDYRINKASEDKNGNWSCMFSNYLGDGDKSESIPIKVKLTPKLPGNVTTESYTAVCFVIFVDPGTISPNLRQTYTNMSISWYADKAYDHNQTVILPANTTKYIVYDVEENTNYTIEVYYINYQGTGATATAFVTTKEFPHKNVPVIERSWFSAVAKIDITNPESVSRIDMLVCGSEDDINCFNKSTTDIEKGDFEIKLTSLTGRYVNVSLYDEECLVLTHSGNIDAPVAAIAIITLGCILLIGLTIVIIVVIIKKQDTERTSEEKARADDPDTYAYSNPTMVTNTMSGTGTGPAKALNATPVYAEVNRGRQLAPLAVSADGDVYSQVDWSKKNARQSLKGLPMSKKAIDRIIFHQKDGYVNMIFQVRKKFTGEIEIGVCRVGDQSCTSKVSKQQEGGSKDVVMVLPIEEMSLESYSIHMKFIERGQVTQTVDLTYPYNKNLVNVAVLNEVYGTTASHNDRPTNVVSPSNADIEVEGVPQRPPRQGAPGEGVTYAVMDWNRSQAPGRPPRLSSRSPAQEHVVYAHVRPGGNVY